MSRSEEEFLEELRKAFAVEAEEHLQTIVNGLIRMEKGEHAKDREHLIEEVFRAAHSLKGAARAVNMAAVGNVCQAMENVFSALKKGLVTLATEGFDTLQRGADTISHLLASPEAQSDETVEAVVEQIDHIVNMEGASPGKLETTMPFMDQPTLSIPKAIPHIPPVPIAEDPPPPPGGAFCLPLADAPEESSSASDTIHISASKLDGILLQGEELISIKLAAEQHIFELRDILALFAPWKKELERAGTSVPGMKRPVPAGRRPAGQNGGHGGKNPLLDSWDWNLSRMMEVQNRLEKFLDMLQADRRTAGLLVDRLLDDTKTAMMQPFSTLLQAFPKMVRDISRAQKKDAVLSISGGDIEIDKRILKRLKDPLIHLLRNSLDHGIEPPEVRRERGKPQAGAVSIGISHIEGNKVQILVSDDGYGIDTDLVREAALKRGLISAEEVARLDDHGLWGLIFQSGVSTSPIITDISGRGLGMAIVEEAVHKVGGDISIESVEGKGTTFRMLIPLTLATFRGVLIQEYGHVFVVPTSTVERVLRFEKAEVRRVENRETICVDNTPTSLVRLGQVLQLPPPGESAGDRNTITAVVLTAGSKRMAFAVEAILNEQEVLIKNLGRQLVRLRNIAGATVLGSGRVAPVLNVTDLMRSALRASATALALSTAATTEVKRKSVLVAEDSITSRMLLTNILGAAGYEVKSVVDGMEAWRVLSESSYDILVSDVEMPGMSGFELTRQVRADKKLEELPVVLVTSLASPEDRERGVEAGADAYIVKSSFDQSHLLEVLKRLV